MSMYYSEPLTQESLVRLLRSFDAQAEDATELCQRAADRIAYLEAVLREVLTEDHISEPVARLVVDALGVPWPQEES